MPGRPRSRAATASGSGSCRRARYRIVSGTVERPIEVASGDELTISVSRDQGQASAGGDTTFRVSAKDRTAYGTRFNGAALQLLPDSNGVYGLIERSDPLVVTDLMEGGGTYLSRSAWARPAPRGRRRRSGSGDADITDPDRTGFAMLYPNLNALEAVSVATAGVHPDTYGSGTMVMLMPRMPASTWQRTFEFMASPPAFQSVNPLPDAPALARLRNSASGSFVAQRPGDRPRSGCTWPATLRGIHPRRARCDRPSCRATSRRCRRTLSSTGPSDRDDVRIFARAIGSRCRRPRGRCWSIPAVEQREQSMLVDGDLESCAPGRARLVGHADAGGRRRRLRRWPASRWSRRWSGCATGRSTRWPRRGRAAGGARRSAGAAKPCRSAASDCGTSRNSAQPPHGRRQTRRRRARRCIGELVDGEPARAWEYTTDGGTVAMARTELALWATDEIRHHVPRSTSTSGCARRPPAPRAKARSSAGARCRPASSGPTAPSTTGG